MPTMPIPTAIAINSFVVSRLIIVALLSTARRHLQQGSRRAYLWSNYFGKLCLGTVLAALFVGLSVCAASAQTTIVSVTGPGSNGIITNGPGGIAAASSWSQTDSYSNVSVSAVLDDLGSNPWTGTAYLTTALGPTTTSSDVVASTEFDVPANVGFSGVDTSLFSGLTLPGNQTYYLVINDNAYTGNDNPGWVDTGSPNLTTAPGVSNVTDYLTSSASAFTPSSDFFESNYNLKFSVVAEPVVSAVPESSSLALILPSVVLIAGLALFSRQRKALQA